MRARFSYDIPAPSSLVFFPFQSALLLTCGQPGSALARSWVLAPRAPGGTVTSWPAPSPARLWGQQGACPCLGSPCFSVPFPLSLLPGGVPGLVARWQQEADGAEPPLALSLLLLPPRAPESSGAGEHPGSPAGNVQEIIQRGKCLPAAQVLAGVNESLGV